MPSTAALLWALAFFLVATGWHLHITAQRQRRRLRRRLRAQTVRRWRRPTVQKGATSWRPNA